VVFLEASRRHLVRRFDSVRRPHPLQEHRPGHRRHHGRAGAAARVRGDADLVLDTSRLNVHELRARMRDFLRRRGRRPALRVNVMSFGYKYGLPVDADMVADCRFLPNPHWVPELPR
jgi:UPF0042 nucleotide-binding protein